MNIRTSLPFVACAMALLIPHRTNAIQWLSSRQTIEMEPWNSAASVEFKFLNNTAESVFAYEALPDCPCVETKFTPVIIPPGSIGLVDAKITGIFTAGSLTKNILFRFESNGLQEQYLIIELNKPKVCDIVPIMLEWSLNTPPEPLRARIKLSKTPSRQYSLLPLEAARFKVNVESMDDDGEIILSITPKTTDRPFHESIAIDLLCQEHRFNAGHISLMIR